MTTISARAVLVSRHAQSGTRIATLLLRYPRWIHAEARTHRLIPISEEMDIEIATPSLMEDENLSRNAASSRAIPVTKLIQDVLDDPAIPLFWGKNQKGMQAIEEFVGEEREILIKNWLQDRDEAVARAKFYADFGCHKQIVNRLLEPFSHITVVATATDWNNFLSLRDHKDAEPHIGMLAREIRKALDEAEVQVLQPGEWHLPFVSADDWAEINGGGVVTPDQHEACLKLSVARCASTSYKTVDGFDMTPERAIALHDKLVAAEPLHASPAEHQAQADEFLPSGSYSGGFWQYEHEWGNLRHFRQYRKMLPNEWVPG